MNNASTELQSYAQWALLFHLFLFNCFAQAHGPNHKA